METGEVQGEGGRGGGPRSVLKALENRDILCADEWGHWGEGPPGADTPVPHTVLNQASAERPPVPHTVLNQASAEPPPFPTLS
eukprot:362445-Chlamydomonas_euryale.AAC.3